MKIILSRLTSRRMRLFLALMFCIFITDFTSAVFFLNLKKSPTVDLNLLKSLELHIKSQDEKMQNIYLELKKLNKQFDKELSFRDGLKFVLRAEGGISDDKADIGGLTNMGITHTEYDSYRASKRLPLQSVKQISLAEVKDIYRHNYWLESGCSDTPRRIAISCFDFQVNSGRGFSTLQQVLGVNVDGFAGHETFNELDWWLLKRKEDKLLHNYFQIRDSDYRHWGVGSQAVFLTGWLRRSQDLKKYLHVR